MRDIGHEETEIILQKMERQVQRVYRQAAEETEKKLNDYLARFAVKDKIKQEKVKKGEITAKEYAQWRKGQICIGQRWQEMLDTLSSDLTNADKIAMSIVNGYSPEVYALNHNYATFQVEQASMVDTSYTLYDRQTVEKLLREDQDLLPKAHVDVPKDKRWNKQHIRQQVTQGILQGEDLGKIAKRLQTVTDMDHSAAVRNARTITTGAENAGRVDSYKRAEGMGIRMEQEWLATLDGRTRHSHRMVDGERVKVGEKFSNGCRFPGDPDGPPWEVYNCRCTLVPAVHGVDQSNAPRNSKLGGMTYEEWKREKANPPHPAPSVVSEPLNSHDVYTINKYKKSGFAYRLNSALRGDSPMTDELQQLADDIDKAITKLPIYTGTVYRSLDDTYMKDVGAFWSKYAVGNIVTEASFTSTSTEVYDSSMGIQMIIHSKNGRDMRMYNPNELEVLFKRGTKFLVKKRIGNTIWLEEM